MRLFALFFAVPIIEIALFIQIGGAIGFWPTMAIIILTAFVGTSLMRKQGMMTLNRLQNALSEGTNPTDPMAQGAMILVAGILLLTPGFFTDAVGFSLMVPGIRAALIRWVAGRIGLGGVARGFTSEYQRHQQKPGSGTIDGDYTVLDDDDDTPPENPSGWSKH